MAKDQKTADLYARREGRKKDSQAEGYFSQETPRTGRTGSSRIVAVPLGQILPDQFQPRPILPLEIKEPFITGEITWQEAAAQWLEMAENDAAVSYRVNTLIDLGETFEEHGQIKPVTGVWEVVNEKTVFHLETGERRFWAKALAVVKENLTEESHLECREIDDQRRSRERQVVENIHAESPTAVARAREIAALVLSKLKLPEEKDPLQGEEIGEYDYFRSALDLKKLTGKKQMPAGVWEEVGDIMSLSRPVMVRHLNILELPNELQYLADLNRLSERVLREIMKLSPGKWEKAIKKAVKDSLTAQEMSDYVDQQPGQKKGKPVKRPIESPTQVAARRIRLFFKSAQVETVREKLGEVATDFAAGMKNAQILEAASLLEDLAAKLRQRTKE